MLDEPTPTDADPTGDWYCFERGATKSTGGEGWADVWKRNHFGWEYKGKRKDLDSAFGQLQQYALALENPPLLVVCDLDRFRIHTNWTNSVSQVHEFALGDLCDAGNQQKLKWVLSDPERLRPGQTRQALTEKVAGEFAKLAQRLRDRGNDSEAVAHFINRLVFCMFAEDVGLLPNNMFKRMLAHAHGRPHEFHTLASDLFGAMMRGGRVGFEHVEWFNGGLFDDSTALPLDKDDIALTLRAANLDWAEIDPSIFGTLFERGLDPDKRSQLGAHYTDRNKILTIVEPVIVEPWLREWESAKTEISDTLTKSGRGKSQAARTRAREQAVRSYRSFLDRLRGFRVLDPACGSGNFLYLALLALKDVEHRVGIEAEALGLAREFSQIGPEAVQGIEINPYAAELARVTVWIGEIQWMRRNGFGARRNPILKPLDTIECRDAVLNADGTEASWPESDVVIGNPPFLGNKKMLRLLGDEYVRRLRAAYSEQLEGACDLVCYWFEKARHLIMEGRLKRAGLVATKTIQSATNREVLTAIRRDLAFFNVWANEEWAVDGADVRVALIAFAPRNAPESAAPRHDGQPVSDIFADLTARSETRGLDLSRAAVLPENANIAFRGIIKTGAFDIKGEIARVWLAAPLNPNGRPNSDVLRPLLNGSELTKKAPERWIVDFGTKMSEAAAAMYEMPFAHLEKMVKAKRQGKREAAASKNWWLHQRSRPEMRSALRGLERCILTGRVSRHPIFVWSPTIVAPDSRLVVFARDDDTTFGVLHSRFHASWALRKGMMHGKGNDPQYTPTEGFQTYPFPQGLTPNIPAQEYAADPRAVRIAGAARKLHELREAWLKPANLVRSEPEVASGFPDRVLPVNEEAAAILKKRTLTSLYKERPTWLRNAHASLDAAIASAYGWAADISEGEALAALLELNLSRSE